MISDPDLKRVLDLIQQSVLRLSARVDELERTSLSASTAAATYRRKDEGVVITTKIEDKDYRSIS